MNKEEKNFLENLDHFNKQLGKYKEGQTVKKRFTITLEGKDALVHKLLTSFCKKGKVGEFNKLLFMTGAVFQLQSIQDEFNRTEGLEKWIQTHNN